jgi:DNA-binding CsgD family transcriptional regulator
MGIVRVLLVLINAGLFAVILFFSFRYRRHETSPRIRKLWLVVGLTSVALLLGAIQRLVLQSSLLGWLPPESSQSLLTNWQIVQSLFVLITAFAAFYYVRDVAVSVASTEKIAGSLLDRVRTVDLAALHLTKRESEILSVMSTGLHTDAELTEALGISANTVHTHINHLLKKTGLSGRQDLVALAVVINDVTSRT